MHFYRFPDVILSSGLCFHGILEMCYQQTDQRTNRPMDKASYRDAWTHLKIYPELIFVVKEVALPLRNEDFQCPNKQEHVFVQSFELKNKNKNKNMFSSNRLSSLREDFLFVRQKSLFQIDVFPYTLRREIFAKPRIPTVFPL